MVSLLDELYQMFDRTKRLCLNDHATDSKHGIVRNRFYIVFDTSKYVFKDMRTIIKELEIGKQTTIDRVVYRCTLHMVRNHKEVYVFKLFAEGDVTEEFIKDWEQVTTIIGPIAAIAKCILSEGGMLEWEYVTNCLK